jgi:hypothetical protein
MKMKDILGEIAQTKVLGSRNLTLIRVFETEEEFKDCAFPGAVGADDSHPLTSIYLEGTIEKDILFGEGFTYIIERNHFF